MGSSLSKILLWLGLALLTTQCVSGSKNPKGPGETKLQWRKSSWQSIGPIKNNRKGILQAIDKHLRHWQNKGRRTIRVGELTFLASQYLAALQRSKKALQSGQDIQRAFSNFELLTIRGSKKFPLLLTSYYEPVVRASRVRTPEFFQPLYERPKNLVAIDINGYRRAFPRWGAWQNGFPERVRGRLRDDGRIVPFYSRREIDQHGLLTGQAGVIAYVNPVDAFFLQIQGSGVLHLGKNKFQTVGYADQNGHGYYAIGRSLLDLIPKEKMSMQAIRDFLNNLEPRQAYHFMSLNPSYVFFRKLKGRGQTSLGTEVIDQVTLASDPKVYPRGVFSLLSYQATQDSDQLTNQIVVHQDTGGAIKGSHRADLFWGRGQKAEEVAGKVKNPGRIYLLIPKILIK